MTYSALISCIFNLTGIEFGAHFTQTAIELYIKSMNELKASAASTKELPSKQATNLMTLLSHLYNFSVVGAPLVYDLVRGCLARMQEIDVEIVLKILRTCGSQMRGDDPRALKDIVALVHEKSVLNNDP
ncbi:suppressor of glycerol defect, partial [Physocladia obscura]